MGAEEPTAEEPIEEGAVDELSASAAEPPALRYERRLLVHADSVHTESGAHAKVVESWESWRRSVELASRTPRLDVAEERLEKLVGLWERRTGARARPPWS